MAIISEDGLIAAPKVPRSMGRTATRTTVAGGWFSIFDLAGSISGVLAGGETAPPANTVGRVPTDAIPGYPDIPFGSNLSYLAWLAGLNTVSIHARLFDRVWVGGPYNFNAGVAVTPPSFASRVSYNGGSADYNGIEIWVEQVTAATGNQAVNATYTNQAGATGKTTGATGIGAAPTVGRCWQLPLATGDAGVQAITNVAGSVASAGTFNVMLLRPVVDIYLPASTPVIMNWADLALPEIFNDSALYWLINAPSGTSSGTIAPIDLKIANG